jgi:hypothetical protein
MLKSRQFADQFFPIQPLVEVALADALPFDCTLDQIRDPRQTRGAKVISQLSQDSACCDTDNCC